jgi:hypothetical protein
LTFDIGNFAFSVCKSRPQHLLSHDLLRGMDFVLFAETDFMNFRYIAALILLFLSTGTSLAQEPETRNVILVTLDGFRWQELFKGADPAVISDGKYVLAEDVQDYWHPEEMERRKLLMPFVWNHIASEGQLYGNREHQNKVNCTNHHLLSYPGYSEMLVGFRHRKVSSNRKIENPHATVFEMIGDHGAFENEVAAFATWDAFPYILRESKSQIHLNAGGDLAEGRISRKEKLLNRHHQNTNNRSDSLTFHYALEYLKRERPRVTFISFDETDKHAHAGRYDEYLKAAHRADRMIAELWRWVQSQDDYRDKTTLFITTDHGRGSGKNNWRAHRLFATGSRHIWFAVVGPDTPAFGEMKMKTKTFQNQVAKTIAAFLGLPYRNVEPVGEVVQTMIALPEHPSAYGAAKPSR